MIRLFTALEIPDEAAERLQRLQQGIDGARWVERTDLHITLRFIGDVPEDVADDIDEALSDGPAQPFEIEIEGVGEFGGKAPHTLWAGVRKSEPLRLLQERQERALRRIGVAPDKRKFIPHVTIARLGRVSTETVHRFIEANNLFAAPAFTVERFTLYSARSRTGGGPYVAEKHYPDFYWEAD
ncbi:MAG: RNA 2',3'-cyclic phosphodiesterase [Alphaproteobacteria bacterium HGW-Alphaproteobacteria-12]|nr:MAG: RNA 2',3'-cyclic phosphodiesterase [Alphaproteobacteria bacterium HGW-Alphaproteobacteria-12]